MRERALRDLITCVLVIVVPLSLFAADTNAAMLYTSGAAWVNGVHVPRPTASIFFGDVLQTRSDSVANINQPGSTITVLSDSLVKFEGASVQIEHGGVTVSTARGTTTSAGIVRVAPTSHAWTEFEVRDVDGLVRIAALKGDVTVSDDKDTVTLAQGQETTRDESSDDQDTKKRRGRRRGTGGAIPAAGGGALSSPIAVGVGGGVAAGLIIWSVFGHDDDPISPAKPGK